MLYACVFPDDGKFVWHSRKLTQSCSIRLSEHFFAENLLDRTLFLEWYLSYLETCSLDMLPVAYLMSSIYWKDLLGTRRLGRRLVEALLGKGDAVCFPDAPELAGINMARVQILSAEGKDVFAPLMRKLSSLLTVGAHSYFP
jgi:mediator of RNA polymerase II transcription subunit 12